VSRTSLRLVEPLSEQTSIPEMMPPGEKAQIYRDQAEIGRFLQLFLLWPEYSSAVIRQGNLSGKVVVRHDESLNEIENLLLLVGEDIYRSLKISGENNLKLLFEVFGLTFQFDAVVLELADEYSSEEPVVSIAIPDLLERLGVRRSKRIQLEEPISLNLFFGELRFSGQLVEVSPRGFKFRVQNLEQLQPCDRFKAVHPDWEVEMSMGQIREGVVIGLPLEQPATAFGAFFEAYIRFAYPMLRPRHSFPIDPIPDLAIRTGQAKKFAANEQSETWLGQIKDAYEASRDAQHEYTADYVAVDEDGAPVGASSMAKGFVNHDGSPMWAFHGLSAVKNPKNLQHTAAVYLWRADYLIARQGTQKVIGWFDGNGRWLEKVFVKFQKLTPSLTSLWSVRLKRMIAVTGFREELDCDLFDKTFSKGKFFRGMCFSTDFSLGLGVPYLNLSGGMDKAYYLNESADPRWIETKISELKPARFFCPVPHSKVDPYFEGYESYTLESVTRQFSSDSLGLLHFHSAVEHSTAITRRKYAV